MSERLSPKKGMAAGMAALAIAGFAAESATARPMGGGRRAAGIEATQGKEAIPGVVLKEKVLKMLSSGRLPNRVLDIVMTFSQDSRPVFFYAPSGNSPDTRLISGTGSRHFMGRSPREVRYNGHNWLIFNDTTGRQADPSANGEQVTGVANDTKYTYFMRTDRLPKGTKVYKSRDGDVSGHLLPAHIDGWENVVAKGIKPGEAETLVTFDSQEPISSLVEGMGLIETHANIDDLL